VNSRTGYGEDVGYGEMNTRNNPSEIGLCKMSVSTKIDPHAVVELVGYTHTHTHTHTHTQRETHTHTHTVHSVQLFSGSLFRPPVLCVCSTELGGGLGWGVPGQAEVDRKS